jgi:hypothetical protein
VQLSYTLESHLPSRAQAKEMNTEEEEEEEEEDR